MILQQCIPPNKVCIYTSKLHLISQRWDIYTTKVWPNLQNVHLYNYITYHLIIVYCYTVHPICMFIPLQCIPSHKSRFIQLQYIPSQNLYFFYTTIVHPISVYIYTTTVHPIWQNLYSTSHPISKSIFIHLWCTHLTKSIFIQLQCFI